MLRALAETGVRPDLVIGTSVGAINGAFVAADPDSAADRLGPPGGGGPPPAAGVQRDAAGPAHPAGPLRHSPARNRAVAADAGRRAAGQGLQRPAAAVERRGGPHRDT